MVRTLFFLPSGAISFGYAKPHIGDISFMTPEQLAQHIASEWGPLEVEERVKMIVVVRAQIEEACAEAYRQGQLEGWKDAIESERL